MLFRFLAVIFLLAAAVYWFNVRMRPQDIISYNTLIQESQELRTHHALEDKPALQTRRGVQKDIWSQGEVRHYQIQSEESRLTLTQKKDRIEALEELKAVRCAVEDDFTFTADEGTYTFPSQQFVGKKNCHLVQEQNQIDGTRIQFDLSQEIVTYDNPKGFLSSVPLHFTAEQLIWHKKDGKIFLKRDVHVDQPGQFELIANLGTLSLEELHPTLLVLEGNVRLISSRLQGKESYAIADTLTYDPKDETLLFSSAKKVLFWQEGLRLSASEVLVRSDQSVVGRGDVHFAFDLEEQNSIEQLFKQYL